MRISALYRYPVKAIGVEPLAEALLESGRRMPGDRVWAVAQDGAKIADAPWTHCSQFVRGAKSPKLMAITCEMSGTELTVHHPDQPSLTISLPDESEKLIAWLTPLNAANRPAPSKLIAAQDGMTDNKSPCLTILSEASLADLAAKAGTPLTHARFRGNLWIEGAERWQEWQWIGQRLKIGDAEFEITEPVGRCTATHADPATGNPDLDTLALLETHYNHTDFGVFARVSKSGRIRSGDTVSVLP